MLLTILVFGGLVFWDKDGFSDLDVILVCLPESEYGIEYNVRHTLNKWVLFPLPREEFGKHALVPRYDIGDIEENLSYEIVKTFARDGWGLGL